MHPKMTAVIHTLSSEDLKDSQKMDGLQKVMNSFCEATIEYEEKLIAELGIDANTAMNITYLRGRSRWSQELEDRLVRASKAGHGDKINAGSGEEDEQLRALGF